jgi:uncharacterized protein YdaU (DUF1376 family)
MGLINDIRFDLATAYFNEDGDSIQHRRLDRDNARSLIERLEQVYAQITAGRKGSRTVAPQSAQNDSAQLTSH